MLPQTEMLGEGVEGLDLRSDADVLACLLDAQKTALSGLDGCLAELSRGASLLAEAIQNGGRIHYVAAGSSGLMGLADGAELPGTYGLSPESISISMAGGIPTGAEMPGHTEDDADAAKAASAGVRSGDAVIAISASGSTPFPLDFVRHARNAGAKIICIANNKSAPLFEQADCAIFLNTPPELIAGSTRMGAATAQKVALNMMSTLMGIRLGHVHDGMMVNVVADNRKLRQRAEGIIKKIAGVSDAEASLALHNAAGNLKQAILLAAGATTVTQAEQMLTRSGGHLRPALEQL
ncbi:N-acetylmuramic acid 6-phosphate etherase [Ruegeria sp. EL01]|jgi:N-acetylmuramic acid 6-phosphate etherase|uniref:N-acetylmuramic acid 6-phosphate etherase n=1 Tax=Ruegeria sp. EL01 TaxID=2107578 RepID=UPI000EA81A85|nr:N-acetylmuramic acid 6-phosphate etherase [Ruegeria sp. EL01]